MNSLKNKLYNNYTKLSRYNNFPYYYHTIDEKYVYGITRHLNSSTPYVVHTVGRNDTYDSIALYYYNNPTYFWIVCDFNRVADPFSKPEEGSKLKVPVFSSIEFDL